MRPCSTPGCVGTPTKGKYRCPRCRAAVRSGQARRDRLYERCPQCGEGRRRHDSNEVCSECNEGMGLRECRRCGEIKPAFLAFHGRRRTCKNCRKKVQNNV